MSYLLLNRHQWTRQPLLNHTVHQADVPGPHLSYASPVFATLRIQEKRAVATMQILQ